MKQISFDEYNRLRENSTILARDRSGDKVLSLEDGSILKLFRRKRFFSSARLVPYPVRFLNHAEELSLMNIPTVKVIGILKIPEIKRFAVHYQPLEGITLRGYLKQNKITQETARNLAHFFADLHGKGIFFRSIHFGNILVLPDHRFGLIDISDMKIFKKPLSVGRRIRNFRHFTRHDMDQELIGPEIGTFIHTYIEASQAGHKTDKLKTAMMEFLIRKRIHWAIHFFFYIYTGIWKIAMPLLRLNHRLAEGFHQRTLKHAALQPADIWIQAASAGESYLAGELMKHLKPDQPAKLLITSNTKQGLDILNQALSEISSGQNNVSGSTAYFPFDSPALMRRAIKTVKPRMIILLESEIWPGFLYEAKKFGCRVCILNGRITEKSLKRYRIWHSLWQTLKPEKILAISEADAHRFKKLFKLDAVKVMPNIKFDRIQFPDSESGTAGALSHVIQQENPFIVLGSIRKEEEKDVRKIIHQLLDEQPQTVIGLFPRHLVRINNWKKALTKSHIPWILRSHITGPVSGGTLIVWDTFGELAEAYKMASAVFVGGSLARLGGQNFLEPLINGISPVIGPFWDNFSWVGREIMDQGLVRIAIDWKETADLLISDIRHPLSRRDIIRKARAFLSDHQGGTAQATNLIQHFLK